MSPRITKHAVTIQFFLDEHCVKVTMKQINSTDGFDKTSQ